MGFNTFKKQLQENFKRLSQDAEHLFEAELDKDELYNLYQDSFPKGTNEIYRERREHDCSCCRQFIKNIGNVVVIRDNKIETIWDFETNDTTYKPVAEALSNFVKSKAVTNVWVNKFRTIGTDRNMEIADGKVITWEHFYLELPSKFVTRSSKSEAEIMGDLRSTRDVFKRSLDEITEESLLTVLELISQKSLYKGEEWQAVLKEVLKHKRVYSELTRAEKANYAWAWSVKVSGAVGRIRNTSMGTLLVDISDGVELDTAITKYEKIVAPANYKRPKAIFTKRMLEDAKKTMEELGYLESLQRRHATLDDITVNNILFSNKDSAKRIGGDIFEEMMSEVAVNPKRFSKNEEIGIEDFINNVLPTAKEVEVLMENKHASSLVSLIAPENKDGKTMFKWGNGFSWAYTGNMTDSSMKERVKSAGGRVDGVLRFSIQWNDITGDHDRNDLDAHCDEPSGFHIYFGNKGRKSPTGGMLDVDIQYPTLGTPAVENITWEDTSRMKKGTYRFYVQNFANRGGRNGFRAEIEFDGQIFSYDYNKEVRQGEYIVVAEVTFDGTGFTIKEKLPSNVSTREIWGLKTNQFVPVSVAMFSPNYWDEQKGIGHKHYFFMLKGCTNPESPNGFYNEFLKEDLVKHKRVFEALGSRMAVKEVEDQLSGLGFSSTKRNELVVKVKGQTERVLKVRI